ncbi:hypothetical protein BHE74_00053042 [Ensete ventricosum]|nr:hypothetical protein BHE74_00053042 [Ensete ventricosum]
MKEKQQIWFGIARLDAQAVAEAGLPWPRLPLGRIRRCGCHRGELGVAVVDLEVIGAFAAFRQFSPLATGHCPSSLPIREITFLFFYSLSNDSFYYHLSVDNSAVKPQIPRDLSLLVVKRQSLVYVEAWTSSVSAFSSSVGPCWLSQFLYRGILHHETIFLVHHHYRISSNKQRRLPYPIYSRRWLLHLLVGAILPAASVALFSLPRVPVRATAHRLSVLCREGVTSSFSLSNDSKSTTTTLLSLPFRSIDRPSRSSISSAEVNRRQTFTEIDNTAVSLTSGQDLRPSQELDLAGA